MSEPKETQHPVAEPPSVSTLLDLTSHDTPADTSTSQATARMWKLCFLSILIGAVTAASALILIRYMIAPLGNFLFRQRFDLHYVDPTNASLGVWIFFIPIIGGVAIGLLSRLGPTAVRGQGIPEAMEAILFNQSKIPAKVILLRPLAAAISIGTGAPFGVEGPVIQTGGAFGSVFGQFFRMTEEERKALLGAGAAAGLAAVYGTPVAAVLLALELLLFEFRLRSLIPVALASATAAGIRLWNRGGDPTFSMAIPVIKWVKGHHFTLPVTSLVVSPTTVQALIIYALIGLVVGVAAAVITRALRVVEDAFDMFMPVHWMWWPAIASVVVGACALIDYHVLGFGYSDILGLLQGDMLFKTIVLLMILKSIAWIVALGGGSSGGTLAPIFIVGGSMGTLLAKAINHLAALAHVTAITGFDVRVAALVGMAALFAGASRAFLTSVVFAVESTLEPNTLLPVLAGCSTAILVASLMVREGIMTEHMTRRGMRARTEYTVDFLDRLFVRDACSRHVVVLQGSQTLQEARKKIQTEKAISRHHAYPVVDEHQRLIGILSYAEILNPDQSIDRSLEDLIQRAPVVILPENTLRFADALMARHGIGRLVVVTRDHPDKVAGIITRSDLLTAHRRTL
ncbi:MAG TPA: chloride channel protein [Phycisphaerae bacterium]|nr:chloride channel protein [Phycisphaerae bacterium]